MPRPVTVTLAHTLGVDGARARFEEGFDKVKKQLAGGMMFKFEEAWEREDRLTFTAKGLGQRISGEVDIFPEHVRITATLPNILATLAETIAGKVEREGRVLLEDKSA